jgi:hypothetical protein
MTIVNVVVARVVVTDFSFGFTVTVPVFPLAAVTLEVVPFG